MPTVTISDVITAALRKHAANTHTAIPGKVVSWDPATNTANIQIMIATPIYDMNGERSFEDPPVVPAVPILWPRGGGYVITVPLTAGDFVWLMFSEASLAEFRTTGQVSEPTDARRHSFGHAYAIPGAFPDAEPLAAADASTRASAMVVGADGGPSKIVFEEDKITIGELPVLPIEITATAIKLNAAAIDAVALATPTMAGLTACVGAVNALGAAMAAMVAVYNGHTHAVATTGTAAAQTGTAAATGATMAAAPGATGAPAAVAALTVKAL